MLYSDIQRRVVAAEGCAADGAGLNAVADDFHNGSGAAERIDNFLSGTKTCRAKDGVRLDKNLTAVGSDADKTFIADRGGFVRSKNAGVFFKISQKQRAVASGARAPPISIIVTS